MSSVDDNVRKAALEDAMQSAGRREMLENRKSVREVNIKQELEEVARLNAEEDAIVSAAKRERLENRLSLRESHSKRDIEEINRMAAEEDAIESSRMKEKQSAAEYDERVDKARQAVQQAVDAANKSASLRAEDEVKRSEADGFQEHEARLSALQDAKIASLRRVAFENERKQMDQDRDEAARKAWAEKAIASARLREEMEAKRTEEEIKAGILKPSVVKMSVSSEKKSNC